MDTLNLIYQGIMKDWLGKGVFIFISSVSLLELIIYLKIFIELFMFNDKIKNRYEWEEPFKSIISNYRDKVEYSNEVINTRAYVEAQFSSYQVPFPLFKWIKIPVIGTIKLIQNSVSMFILVGVLGTFVGIYEALVSVLNSGESITALLSNIDNISPLLLGMGTAFSTSIVGMSFALLTTMFIKTFNAEQYLVGIMTRLENYLENEMVMKKKSYLNRLFISLTSTLETGFSEIKDETNKVYQAISGFKEISRQFEEAAVHMETFNVDLGGSMNNLKDFYRINKEFTEGYIENVKGLNNNFNQLFDSMNDISIQQKSLKSFIEKINVIQDRNITTLENIEREINQSQVEIAVQTKTMKEINEGHKKTVSLYQDLQKKINLLTEQNLLAQGDLKDSYEQNTIQISMLVANIEHLQNMENEFIEIQRENIEWQSQIRDIIEKHNSSQSSNLDQLFEIISKIENRQDMFNDSYQMLKETITSMSNSISSNLAENINLMEEAIFNIQTQYNEGLNKNVSKFANHVGQVNDVIEKKYNNLDGKLETMNNKLVDYLNSVSFNSVEIGDVIKELNRSITVLRNSLTEYTNVSKEITAIIREDKKEE